MKRQPRSESVPQYVRKMVKVEKISLSSEKRVWLQDRCEKAVSLLPEEVGELFLTGKRKVVVEVAPNTTLPVQMKTISTGAVRSRRYSIVLREEHLEREENHFIGSLLRELGHVYLETPPESEWPAAKAERSLMKELCELRADAQVWKWGLRHYSMAHLSATYPPHWVDRITSDIEKVLAGEELGSTSRWQS